MSRYSWCARWDSVVLVAAVMALVVGRAVWVAARWVAESARQVCVTVMWRLMLATHGDVWVTVSNPFVEVPSRPDSAGWDSAAEVIDAEVISVVYDDAETGTTR